MCLIDLMKQVQTKWFAFIHSDVELTPYSYKQMEPLMDDKVGIIESSHLHIVDGKPIYYDYYHEPRAYSGFQLFYKPAIESILSEIEDDYVYRNEDLIFQNVCEANGFKHKKSYALHLHKIMKHESLIIEKEVHDMQWKGLVKYSRLITPLMKELVVGAIRYSEAEFGLLREEALEFISKENPMWLELVKECI